MEHRDESGNAVPSQGDGAEPHVYPEGGEQGGLNALRWQREDGRRMSLCELVGGR